MQPKVELPPGGRHFSPICRALAEYEPEPVRWLWPGRIAGGRLSLLAGDPGVGKSLLVTDMAARVTTGRPWPDAPDAPPSAPGDVVYIGSEDDAADTIRPRLEAAGGNLNRFFVLEGTSDPHKDGWHPLKFPRDWPVLSKIVESVPNPRLVLIDPLSGFLADSDAHTPVRIRNTIARLIEMMRHAGRGQEAEAMQGARVAVVAITHLNKSGSAGRRAIYRSGGPLAFVGAARAAHLVTRDPDDRARRLMLPLKNNLTGETWGMAFRIDGPKIIWEPGVVTVTPEEALAGTPESAAIEPDRKEQAMNWLTGLLADGPVKSAEVFAQGDALGFTYRTIRQAALSLAQIIQRFLLRHRPPPG